MADDVKIVMFCCNWCSYGGADTAGTACNTHRILELFV